MRFKRNFVPLLPLLLFACGGDANTSGRTPVADKWLERGKASYRAGDFDDAEQSATSGIGAAPHDPELRTLKAKTALTRLAYGEALKFTEGLTNAEALSIRGRALFYSGKIEEAGEVLDTYLRDPEIKDAWARDIARLARGASSRHPFEIEGTVGVVEMPDAGHASIVPCELDGERILAMVATASAELVVDSSERKEPSWVSLRFGDRFEVRDVPALTQDLGALSQKLGAPIKALIGTEVLRHLHATVDRRGDQFVVRKEDAPQPPGAARAPLSYLRGGALVMHAALAEKDTLSAFLIDSAQPFLLTLNDSGWKRSGAKDALKGDPSLPPEIKTANLPFLKVGSFDFSGAPGLQGVPMDAAVTDVELAGVFGAALLSSFRFTFIEEGRSAWLEPDPNVFVARGALSKEALDPMPEETLPQLPELKDPTAKDPKGKGAKTNDPKSKAPTPPPAAKKPDTKKTP